MPSSYKTTYLGLNKFIGTDKPKMADFNNDNLTLDNHIKAHEENTGIHLTTSTVDNVVTTKVNAHEQKTNIHLTASTVDNVVTTKVNAHEQKTNIHLTEANVNTLIKAEYVIGTYSGDGVYKRTIPLGFSPSFGIIFQSGSFISYFDQVDMTNYTGSAFLSKFGCTKGVELTVDGFKLTQSQEAAVDGKTMNFNKSGGKYAYLMLK